MSADQDPVVSRALSDVHLPDHAPGFWERLDRRLEEEETALVGGAEQPSALVNGPAPIPTTDGADGADRHDVAPRHAAADLRTSTGELPSLAELRPPAPAPHRQKIWFAAAAALLVIAASSVVLALRGDDDPETASPGSQTSDTTEVTTSSSADTGSPTSTPTSTSTTDVPTVPGAAGSAAKSAVLDWLAAVGAGDVDTAVALTGPRSTAYVESLGSDASVEGLIRESAEGYGAMNTAPDLEVQDLRLGSFDFGAVSLVAVTGTHGGEGSEGQRETFVFPVVVNGSKAVVEPWTAPPGSLQVTLPEEVAEGRRMLPAGEAVELFTPIDGTVFFSLDDAAEGIRPVETSEVAGAPFARYEPPGELAPGDHLAIVGFVSPDGAMLLGEAIPFGVP